LYDLKSTHGPSMTSRSVLAMPVEPAVSKFRDRRGDVGGSMTPALPSQRLLEETHAPMSKFFRASWRDGREWEPFGVGRPLRDGTILAAEPDVFRTLVGFNLAWCLLRNTRRVALVDPSRRRVFRAPGEEL
jgi:hypothetical protein